MARLLTVIWLLFQSTTHCRYRVYTKFLVTYTAIYRRNRKVLPLRITALQPQSHFHLGTPDIYIYIYIYTHIHTHSSLLHLCLKLHTKKAYKGIGGKSLFIINFGNRFRCVFSFTAGKSTWGMLRCLSKSKRINTYCIAVSAYFVTRYPHRGELVLEFRFTYCGQMLSTSLNKLHISRRDGVAKKINTALTKNRIQVVSVPLT